MALTPNYEHENLFKKLTVGGSIYWLKDADLRELVESFGSVVYKDVVTTFNEEGADIATEAATADYIKEKIAGLEGAMHFMGVVPRVEDKTDRECIDAFYAGKGVAPKAGDVVIMQDNGKEYICSNAGTGAATAVWEEVGDQNIYLTIAAAAATYTPMARTIAGVDLRDDITEAEMETALDLKALAHKASATGTYQTIDDIDDITVGKPGAYNVAGDTVAVPQTYNALDVTPAGTVDITAGTAAAATYQKANAATITAADVAEGQTANYTPAGTVTLPGLTAGVSLSGTEVATVTDAGTGYSMTDGNAVKGDDTKAKFAKKTVSFAVDAEDESLTLAYVTNDDTNFYADAVTAAGEVTYTAPVLTGALPTFGTQQVALTTGATATAAYDGTATFNGKGAVIGATLGYETADANMTQPTFTAEFAGTNKSVTPSAATTANAQATGATVTVASEVITPKANTKDATVTVS